jgi:hypothetical protein
MAQSGRWSAAAPAYLLVGVLVFLRGSALKRTRIPILEVIMRRPSSATHWSGWESTSSLRGSYLNRGGADFAPSERSKRRHILRRNHRRAISFEYQLCAAA